MGSFAFLFRDLKRHEKFQGQQVVAKKSGAQQIGADTSVAEEWLLWGEQTYIQGHRAEEGTQEAEAQLLPGGCFEESSSLV